MAERVTRGWKPFVKGQKVWLEAKNLRIQTTSRKLTPKREGPFTIIDVLGPLTYRLVLPKTWKIHNVFHATLLTPYKENDTHGPNFPQPPAELVDGEDEFEVEAIVGHRQNRARRRHEFLIKWKGWPTAENTWEPTSHLTNASQLLKEYKTRHNLT